MTSLLTKKIAVSGVLAALGLILAQIFHIFSLSGAIFLPLHVPALLCGLICGWGFGGAVGVLTVALASFTTGMPPVYPVGVLMAVELAAYGAAAGLLRKKVNVYIALIAAMLAGRIVYGIASPIVLGLDGRDFEFVGFLTGSFVTALPGIIIQIALIPPIVIALRKSGVLRGLL